LQNIRQHIPDIDTRVAAIFRQNRPIMPKGDTIIEAGDEVFFIAATAQLRTVMREIRHLDKAAKKIMIAGGGNIGRRLAKSLENNYQVKIIDHNRQNCERLANFLESALVLQGEVTDEELLDQENIEEKKDENKQENEENEKIINQEEELRLVRENEKNKGNVENVENKENVENEEEVEKGEDEDTNKPPPVLGNQAGSWEVGGGGLESLDRDWFDSLKTIFRHDYVQQKILE
jgi:hypothetical protein